MKKHHFESLSRVIAEHNARCLVTFGCNASMSFSDEEISALADWCEGQTADKPDGRRFDRARWIAQCKGGVK